MNTGVLLAVGLVLAGLIAAAIRTARTDPPSFNDYAEVACAHTKAGVYVPPSSVKRGVYGTDDDVLARNEERWASDEQRWELADRFGEVLRSGGAL